MGHIDARIRDRLWERIIDLLRDGRAVMVYSARNEQHMAFKVYGADWSPVDCDGLQLIKRPKEAKEGSFVGTPRKGWSNASKYRKARKFSKTKLNEKQPVVLSFPWNYAVFEVCSPHMRG